MRCSRVSRSLFYLSFLLLLIGCNPQDPIDDPDGPDDLSLNSVSLTSDTATVDFGGSVILTWTTDGVDRCTASGGWSGDKPITGSETLSNLTSDSTYVLTCDGGNGSISDSITITVAQEQPPTLNLIASVTRVKSGGETTLSWTANNVTACTASGDWSGSRDTTGMETRSPILADSHYTLTCTRSGVEVSRSIDVTVIDDYVLGLTGTPSRYVNVNSIYRFIPSLQQSDPPGPVIFSVENLPSWAEFDTSTGALTGVPTLTDVGDYLNITLSAAYAGEAVSLSPFSIRVCSDCSPRILYTDIVAGPNSGGEEDNGAYLSIFGLFFGDETGLGSETRVYIGGVEVADYKVMELAKSQFLGDLRQIQKITVQVGDLNSPSPGEALPIQVEVNGISSNLDHSFKVQPGDMIYVALSGSDSTGDGSFENPYRLVQNSAKNNPAWHSWGAGDTLVMRGGTWRDVGADNKFLRIDSSKDGSAPSGSDGNGYMTIMGYPGESVTIDIPYGGGSNGGIVGPGSAFDNMANFVAISNLVVHDDGSKDFGDGGDGPIFSSASGEGWRVVNNEVTAKVGTAVDQRASGIGGGYRDAVILGNYIHDIEGITSGNGPTFLNHGMYFDYNCNGLEIAYNHIENVRGGNSMQWHGASYSDISVHHNVLDNAGKHGFNDNGLRNSRLYNNVVKNIFQAGYRRAANNADSVHVVSNTFYNCNKSNNGNYATWFEDAQQNTGGITYENNILYVVDGRNYWLNNTIFDNGDMLDNNLYFGDGDGPYKDGNAVNGDPRFIDLTSGAEDLRIEAGGAANDSGKTPSITVSEDMLFNGRAAMPDIGAFESVGVP